MIVLAFDSDWTVDVNPHPNREAVPLEYVRYWNKETSLLNRHTALELAGHVLFNVVDETHQDNFTELTIPLTRSDGRAVRALDRGIDGLCH